MKNNVTRGSGVLENFLSKKRVSMANKLISEDKREGKILDFGCGSYPNFLMNTKFKKKYGYDKSLSKNLSIEDIILVTNKETNKLPFKDNYFDVVTMLAVFEHIEKDELVPLLKEFRRILKPNGILIITTPCKWTDKLLRTLAKLNIVSKEEIEEHKDAYNHNDIGQYLKDAEFDLTKSMMGYFELFMNNWVKITK